MIRYYKKDKEYATTIIIFNAKMASSKHLGNQTEDIFGQQFPFRVNHNKNSSLPEPHPDWTNL